MAKSTRSQIVSKKHLARVERERQQTRYIMIGVGSILALVIVLLGFGIVKAKILDPRRPVAVVNGATIPLDEAQANMVLAAFDEISTYDYIKQIFGGDVQQYYDQAAQSLMPEVLGPRAVDNLIQDRIIRQEAKRLGIKVSTAEVEQEVRSQYRYYPNGTPTPRPTNEPIPTQATATYSPQQNTLMPQPPTSTLAPTAVVTETVPTPEPTTIAPTAVLTPTVEPTPYPTATPVSESAYKEQYNGLKNNLKNASVPEKFWRATIESRLYRQRVQEALLKDPVACPTQETWLWARHILVTSEVSATMIINQLNSGEADFAQLAAQYSTDASNKDQAGNLGWFPEGTMDDAFWQGTLALQNVGDITQTPVQSQYGYHIIQLLGKEDRPFTSADARFNNWIRLQRKALEAAGKISIKIQGVEWYNYLPSKMPQLPAFQAAPPQNQLPVQPEINIPTEQPQPTP